MLIFVQMLCRGTWPDFDVVGTVTNARFWDDQFLCRLRMPATPYYA